MPQLRDCWDSSTCSVRAGGGRTLRTVSRSRDEATDRREDNARPDADAAVAGHHTTVGAIAVAGRHAASRYECECRRLGMRQVRELELGAPGQVQAVRDATRGRTRQHDAGRTGSRGAHHYVDA